MIRRPPRSTLLEGRRQRQMCIRDRVNTTLFRWPVRVYYEDTDAGGVVYHASYVAFYERARTEMLRHHHFSQQVLLAERVAFVVRKMTLEYFAPARLDDMLEVQTEITSMRGTSLVFTQRIVNAENTVSVSYTHLRAHETS